MQTDGHQLSGQCQLKERERMTGNGLLLHLTLYALLSLLYNIAIPVGGLTNTHRETHVHIMYVLTVHTLAHTNSFTHTHTHTH